MKTNWKKKVDELNRKRFTIPEGWETRDQVAESLECSAERVDKLLKPGIDDGSFERKLFPVWDDARRLTVQVPCYRMTGAEKAQHNKIQYAGPSSLDEKIARSILRNPGHTDTQIRNNIRGSTPADVARVRASLK